MSAPDVWLRGPVESIPAAAAAGNARAAPAREELEARLAHGVRNLGLIAGMDEIILE
jgi:hypothetical protein